ncbi:MAG: hypothetical protein AAFZ65_15555, partial [Planctomycetota bacterium]
MTPFDVPPAQGCRLGGAASLLLLALAASCSRDDALGGVPSDPAVYDLVAEHPWSERAGVTLEILPAEFEDAHFMSDGWTLPSPDGKQVSLWSDARSAEFTFVLPAKGPLELFTLAKAMVPEDGVNPTKAFFNGVEVGQVDVGAKWTEIQVALPEGRQLGPELVIRFVLRPQLEGSEEHAE